jgi:hypothetical protein
MKKRRSAEIVALRLPLVMGPSSVKSDHSSIHRIDVTSLSRECMIPFMITLQSGYAIFSATICRL